MKKKNEAITYRRLCKKINESREDEDKYDEEEDDDD